MQDEAYKLVQYDWKVKRYDVDDDDILTITTLGRDLIGPRENTPVKCVSIIRPISWRDVLDYQKDVHEGFGICITTDGAYTIDVTIDTVTENTYADLDDLPDIKHFDVFEGYDYPLMQYWIGMLYACI